MAEVIVLYTVEVGAYVDTATKIVTKVVMYSDEIAPRSFGPTVVGHDGFTPASEADAIAAHEIAETAEWPSWDR